ncbi:MAG: hypothetical protein ACI9WU_004863 [Myxococcota bacterium]|jgi:hypothetical protein
MLRSKSIAVLAATMLVGVMLVGVMLVGVLSAGCTPTPKPHPSADPWISGHTDTTNNPFLIGVPDAVVFDAGVEGGEGAGATTGGVGGGGTTTGGTTGGVVADCNSVTNDVVCAATDGCQWVGPLNSCEATP